MLLPMVPNVTFSGYGFVPLPPYLERERPPPMWQGQTLFGVGFCNTGGQNGLPRGLDLAPSESAYFSAKFGLPWLHLRPPGLGLTSLGPEVAFFHPKGFPVVLPAALYLGFLEPELVPIVSEASTFRNAVRSGRPLWALSMWDV
jgi:hypothetical protein